MVSIGSALEHQYGTVGKVLPGIEYRLEPVAGIDARAAPWQALRARKNVMKGYLKNEEAMRKFLIEDKDGTTRGYGGGHAGGISQDS